MVHETRKILNKKVLGKTVYVLGAGASAHAGAPLLRNFLIKSRPLRDGRDELVYRESLDRVFDWIDGLRGSSYYIEFDLDNLEHIFSLLELESQIGVNGASAFNFGPKSKFSISSGNSSKS